MGVALKVRGIAKTYGGTDVFLDANFNLKGNQICGLVGASGSGKSTLLHALVGFVPVDEGNIIYSILDEDLDMQQQQQVILHHVGFASQKPSYYAKLTVLENLLYFASLYGKKGEEAEKKAEEVLSLVGLSQQASHYASALSQGMGKRLDIACALIHDPQFLILDEPMADLDPVLRKQLWVLLEQIKNAGKSIIISSHILSDVDEYCDSLCVLHKSRLYFYEKAKDIYKEFKAPAVLRVRVHEEDMQKVQNKLNGSKKLKIQSISENGNFLDIETLNASTTIQTVLNVCKRQKITIQDIEYHAHTLEAVFETMTRGDE